MKWIALLSLIAANFVQQPAPVVRTSSGLVRGRVSENGLLHYYFGIPYGTVTSENRFQAPLPPPKWKGVLEAVNENTRCPQKLFGLSVGDPNCLKLNIYTPARKSEELLPVMVYIHGGCFFEGTGSPFIYGGDYLAKEGVVFVGINYRINVEGFLCLGIEEAPGNAGIKDQIAALKWIQNNIEAFGGNKNNVTLFGESAGAVSTSLLILSSAAKGLFHKAILQSGSTLAPWAIQHDPIKTASDLVKELGYDTKDPYEIYEILSKKEPEELIDAIKYGKHKNYITADVLFVPCVERKIPGVLSVINEYPSDIIASGNYTKMPMIIGFNDNEGIYFVSKDYGITLREVGNLSEIFKEDLIFPSKAAKDESEQTMRRMYFSQTKEDYIMDMVALYSDLHFKYPMIREAELFTKTNEHPIYFYLFKYSGIVNWPKTLSLFMFSGGASHGDELMYIFRPHAQPIPYNYDLLERDMRKRMVMMWTNFAKYSDPTPTVSDLVPVKWVPSKDLNATALSIDRHVGFTQLSPQSVHFWNSTYNKYRRKNHVEYAWEILVPKQMKPLPTTLDRKPNYISCDRQANDTRDVFSKHIIAQVHGGSIGMTLK